MKNSLVTILLCLSFLTIYAQKIDYGIGIGLNQSYPSLESELNTANESITKLTDPGFGFSIFTMVMYNMSDHHQIRLDPTIRFSTHESINVLSSSWDYVRIEPAISYHFLVKNIDFGAGLHYGYLLNSTIRTSDTNIEATDSINRNSLGLNASIAYDLFKYISIELQYARGLTYPNQTTLLDSSLQQLGEIKERQDYLELRVLARVNR